MKTTFVYIIFALFMISVQPSSAALFPKPCQTCQKKIVVSSCKHAEPTYGCKCSDLGFYYNDCISKEKYCHEFGNVGAIDIETE